MPNGRETQVGEGLDFWMGLSGDASDLGERFQHKNTGH